jgi:HKD family nuclease
VINVAKQIEASTPSRSLLMTYCASLPFFERDILPYLQQVGDGRVTVLLGLAQYEASFSDFVRDAGTRYRLHPVRLPHKSANFHPKLYLLMGGSKVDLLVGSANLTPSGFGSNAEIIDQLTLSKEHQEDAAAIAQYAAMLRLLPALDPRLPEQVVIEIEKIASDLERLGATKADSLAGPWFLHTIEETLLAQIGRLIPPSEVKQITAISPFFDDKSLAILKLAETYDRATIRLIKDAQPDSMNGQALTKLGSRITVEELGHLADEEKRRLHAKLLLLQSNSDEWVVSGSANLTRSAWLSSAMSSNSGNVEAVVVRRFALGSAARLLRSISTTKVDHRNLRRAASSPTSSDDDSTFTIIDAELSGQELKVLIEPHDNLAYDRRFRVYLEQTCRRIAVTPEAERFGKRIRLTASVRGHTLDHDRAISATVEVTVRGRQPSGVRTWVAIPSTLAFNSSQRNVRSAARDVCRTVFLQDEAAGVIADAITRFLTDLGGLAHDQAGHASHEERTEGDTGLDRELSKRDFVVKDDALGTLHASHARTAQALTGLAALLEKLLVAADEVNDVAAPADEVDERRPEDQESDESANEYKQRGDDRKKKVKRAEETLDQLDTAFRDTVNEALRQEVSEAVVPFLLKLPTAAIAYVLLHAQIGRRLGLDTGYKIAHEIREILREAFSIDGMTLGGSYGWLVRAWASEQCRPRLDESLRSDGTINELIAFVAAGLAFDGPLRASDEVAQGILAGLHLVTGRIPGDSLEDELRDRLAAVSESSGGTFGLPELQAVIASFAPEKLTIVSSVLRWKLLKAIDAVDGDPTRVSEEITELRRLAPELWAAYSSIRTRLRPPLSQASAIDNEVKCGSARCQMILSGASTQKLAAPPPAFVQCDFCHRILIAVNINDGISEQIVLGLESMTEVTHA